MIAFLNEPKLSEHKADRNLISQIRNFLSIHDRFKGKEVGITFATTGASSLVIIIESSNEKSVLKIRTNVEGEAQFLKVWKEVGVNVPHVFEEGRMGEHSYVLMEYVDAPILTEACAPEELAEKGIYREMGQLLRLMHTPKAKGYGSALEGKAAYSEFREWLLGVDVMARIRYARRHLLLGNEHGSVGAAFEILQAHVSEQNHSSYCHDDFSAANIFATRPVTVFDPNPTFNDGYIDLGRSLIIHISQGIPHQQLVEGYFAGITYSERALHAAVLLNAYMKVPHWHKIKRSKQIENIQKYLYREGNRLTVPR